MKENQPTDLDELEKCGGVIFVREIFNHLWQVLQNKSMKIDYSGGFKFIDLTISWEDSPPLS